MEENNENELVELISIIVEGLRERGYNTVVNNINECLSLYYKSKMEKEFFDSIESPEQMDFSMTLVEEDSTSPIKQLVTDTVAILYFNFVERFKMVDKIGDYFAENFQVQEDNIIFAMPETSQDSKDMSMVEFKKAFIEGQKIESILKRIIYIANKNGLLIDNSLLGGAIND